ncbi:carboxymuconolactone decarboxylase family protein [Nocardioides mangrovicus]|uniref:Carboxymuconolactone decarboxylase family protein n=1 Tax=Nocardioides mangrovicus TaxID=2478913 RepID=A0A3L8P6A7_9ACTN|nr:carboxymuconolactone decarboxylase family protein [Nocardioides mangrovicus]RLV49978.1 carboxymuconolactone decarboxylase family protein [Nocardioides mangrovicus]
MSAAPRGTRLAKLDPAALQPDAAELYASIARGPRAQGPQLFALLDEDGGLEGPFNAMLLSPRVGAALQAVGAAVRYGTALSDRAREIAILVVAARWDSDFERYAHEAVGRAAGLSDEAISAIRAGEPLVVEDPDEALVARLTTRLAHDGDLDDAEYAEAVTALGEAQLFELLTLVGYYATLALQLRVFRVAAPDV